MQVQYSNPSNTSTGSEYGRIVATLPKNAKSITTVAFPLPNYSTNNVTELKGIR